MKKFIPIFAICLTLCTGQLMAIVYANHTCEAYNSCEDGGKRAAGPSMGRLIIEGAGYFLKSHAHMLLLLNQVEISELNGADFLAMQTLVNNALENMQKAGETYKYLIAVAKDTPYNPEIIARLMDFDYEIFAENNGLNRDIVARIEPFLKKGDVTGLYALLKSDMAALCQQLQLIKTSFDNHKLPGIPLLWQLNQIYINSMLSGQYLAQFFAAL